MLNWVNRFNICCFLDNHKYHLTHTSIECILAAGSLREIRTLKALKKNDDWIFGHLAYDLKNEIENLTSSHHDGIGFPDVFFFVPQYVLKLNDSSLVIGSTENDHEEIFLEISAAPSGLISTDVPVPVINNRFTKDQYIATVEKLQQHILRGDCYEINLCQEFFAENVTLDALQLYRQLSQSSPNPFSAYYRLNNLYIACMSPERYLRREGNRILSQPIKGTAERDLGNPKQDALNKYNLEHSDKERAENIMVVDLVRNDLSRVCIQGSVKVDELCAIYSFPQVHQMISTVSGQLQTATDFADIITATFPMGSMTGAPKKKVMELIEKYELTKRGLFSGSIGYINPDGDFDFNVVIRSVLYNSSARYLSFHTGSAITFNSDAEKEYEECLLKAGAIKKALAETNTFH